MIGLIALSTDLKIERDFHQYYKDSDIFTTRVIFNNPINQKNLADIKNQLNNVKEKLPKNITQYVFGCTSATAVIGDFIEENYLNPLNATLEWCNYHNFKKIALFTPYSKDVHYIIKDWFESKQIHITDEKWLNIDSDLTVAHLDQEWLMNQILEFKTSADAVFLSCTNLPVTDLLDKLTHKTGKKYIGSNSALIWQLSKKEIKK